MEGIFKYAGLLEDIFAPVDLLINIGYQYVDDVLPNIWHYGLKKKIIHISNVNPNRINSYMPEEEYKPEYELVGNMNYTLKVLKLDVEKPKQPRIISKLQERYNEIYYSTNPINDPHLQLVQIIKCINEHLDDGIFITDIGYYRHHAVLFSRPERTKQFFTDTGLSSFGSGLPSAAAAQFAYPNKKVFLLCGDGGFHSGSCDLETLARHQLPVTIILINNSSFGLIELYQKKGSKGKPDNKEIVRFTNIDFVKLAEANAERQEVILHKSTLEYMRENSEKFELPDFQKHRFIYKGTNGRWQNLLTQQQLRHYDEIIYKKLGTTCANWVKHGGALPATTTCTTG